MSGKGDRPRPVDKARFEDNFDRIFKQGKYSEQKETDTDVADQARRSADSDEPQSQADGGGTQLQEQE